MCFSATASFTSAALMLAVGGIALGRARSRLEWPYALIPVLFGVQQLMEGFLWLNLRGASPPLSFLSATNLTQGYSLFSQVLWPLFVPLAVGLMERVQWRRSAITATGLSGLVVGLFLLTAMMQTPVTAQIVGTHIAYGFDHTHVVPATVLYMMGTCASPMLSGHAFVRLFGFAAFISAVLSYLIFQTWFISVWCYFAALMSCMVLLHFVTAGRPAQRLSLT